MSLYKPVNFCRYRHDRGECPYAHNFQDYRRDPKKKLYTVILFLISLIAVPTGPKDRSNLFKIQAVPLEWSVPRVMVGLKRNFILTEKNGKQENLKLVKLSQTNQKPLKFKKYIKIN